MELRHLRYFLAVAEENHFGRAAERLHIVQPALSKQIKDLENELGGALFIRSSRRVTLTEAGKLLQVQAQNILAQTEHSRLMVERSLKGEMGQVRVGFAGNAVLSGRLIADMRLFHQRYPQAELRVQELEPHQQIEAILHDQLDIGYLPDFQGANHPALRREAVGSWQRFVAMNEESPLAAHPRLTVEMLADEALILYASHDADARLASTLQALSGGENHLVSRASGTLSVLAMAGAGLGVALVPEPVVQVGIPGIVYRPLDAPELCANLIRVSRKEEINGAARAWQALFTPPSAAGE